MKGVKNMVNKNVEDYLQEGIYGQKQNKPEERNMYLTTLRERRNRFNYRSSNAK